MKFNDVAEWMAEFHDLAWNQELTAHTRQKKSSAYEYSYTHEIRGLSTEAKIILCHGAHATTTSSIKISVRDYFDCQLTFACYILYKLTGGVVHRDLLFRIAVVSK